jgi:flagellar biosynthetic protein FliO
MFGQWPTTKKFKVSKWVWILLMFLAMAGILFAAYSVPTPKAVATPTPAVSTAKTDEGLFNYDPNAGTILEEEPADQRPLWLSAFDLILKLGIVILLIYASLVGLRKLQLKSRNSGNDGAAIRLLETRALGKEKALHLVVVGEKTLLIGATEHQLNLIAELADTSTPLVEEPSAFEETLSQAEKQPALEWQSALAGLRSGVQQFRQTNVRG